MGFLDHIPCSTIVFLILGLVFLRGGITILIQQKTLVIGRDPSLQSWRLPRVVRGKESKLWGVVNIISGVLLQVISKIPCHSPEGHRDGVRERLLRPKSLVIREREILRFAQDDIFEIGSNTIVFGSLFS